MKKIIEKYRLWFFHRNEWCRVGDKRGGMILCNPGCKNALWGTKYHETWRHPQTGYIIHRTMVG